MRTATLCTCVLLALSLGSGCSRQDSSEGAATQDSSSSKTGAAGTSTASNDTIVRGTLKDVSGSVICADHVRPPSGDVRVALTSPSKVFTRAPADLSRVSDHVFIGVTSVPQPDGTQRATEIHIFPEELRGLGEGSRPMGAPSSGSGGSMTNGSVSNSRMTIGSATMTNGSASMSNGSATMTNGTASMKNGSSGGAGRTMTVVYTGGSQTIAVPPNVSVTEIVATSTKLAPGMSVVIPAMRRPDGTLTTSRIMLANARASK